MKPLAQNTLIQNRYLVVHLIGKGGMGEVYLAVDQRLGSAVALKRTFFAGDEMLGNAFEREARTLARMRHPVLPKVSDHFGEGDEQYLVMEHISGDDLSKRLESAGKPFPVSWVLFWADQLLDALSYLHTHEPPIIHRDIKPQNLKLTDENHIILLDFGLSKTSTGHTNISQSGSAGSVVGYTPHYAPMEQIRGIGTSPRSDLYSLSATLYQLLTNVVPVDALSRADTMLNGLPDPITPPHELNLEVPSVVSEVLLRGMEVSQEKRYANAREMQRVLRKAFNELQQATSASTVAFTAEQAEAAGVVPPESKIVDEPSIAGPVAPVTSGLASHANSEPVAAEREPEPVVDLEATMAYGSFDPGIGDTNQSGIKTEVFIAGSHSLPEVQLEPERQDTSSLDAQGSFDDPHRSEAPSADIRSTQGGSGGLVADATVPFISLDQGGAAAPPVPPSDNGISDVPEFFDDEVRPAEVSESDQFQTAAFRPAEEDIPVVEAAPARVAAPPPKKSSGKLIAVIGGLAALLLLAAVVGGGIWAYMAYGPGMAEPEPTPEPTPEATIAPTPSPEPTIESNTNVEIGNSNSSVNGNSNSILVEPTPENRPETVPDRDDARPTPRPPAPRVTPPPKTPPKRGPNPRPTVLP
ncbi:MAG: serine/threonine protein kinase [Acidobacteria bacterium]|nr:serine/threonine protein kinase [Acidobacteriota bacterium]